MSLRIRDPRLLDSRYSAVGYRPEWRQRYVIGEQGRVILGVDLKAGRAFAVSAQFDAAPLAACVAPATPGSRAKNPRRSNEPDYVEFHVYVLTADGRIWRLDRDTLEVLGVWDVRASPDHRWMTPGRNGILFPGAARGEIAMWSQVENRVLSRRVVTLTDSVVAHWIPSDEDRFYVFDDAGGGQVIDWDAEREEFAGRARFRAPAAVQILDTFVDSGEAYLYYPYPQTLTVLALGPRGDGVRADYDLADPLNPVETVKTFDGSEYVIRSGAGAFPARAGTRRDGGQFPQLPWWPGAALAMAPQDPGADRRPGAAVIASEQGDAWVIPDDPPTPALSATAAPLVPEVVPVVADGVAVSYVVDIPYRPTLVPDLLRFLRPGPVASSVRTPVSITNTGGKATLTFAVPPPAGTHYACGVIGTNGSNVDFSFAFFVASMAQYEEYISAGPVASILTDIPWDDDFFLPPTTGNTLGSIGAVVYNTGSPPVGRFMAVSGIVSRVASIRNDGGFVRMSFAQPLVTGEIVYVYVPSRRGRFTVPGTPDEMYYARVRVRSMNEPMPTTGGTLFPAVIGSPPAVCYLNPVPGPNITIDRFQMFVGTDIYWFNSGVASAYGPYDYVVDLGPFPGGTEAEIQYDIRSFGSVYPQTVLPFREFDRFLPPDDDGGAPFATFDTSRGQIGIAVQADVLAFIPAS